MKPITKGMILALAATSVASAYAAPVLKRLVAAVANTASVTPAMAQTTGATSTVSTVHLGTEIWSATDQGAGEAANYDYVIGNGSDVRLIGIYGNASLDNARPDGNDREFLFSVSSANNAGSARLAGDASIQSHHSADPALYAGVLKQTGGNNATLPINVAFPGNGLVLSHGALRIAVVTGVYDPRNGYKPIIYPANSAVLSSELHLTFVYAK